MVSLPMSCSSEAHISRSRPACGTPSSRATISVSSRTRSAWPRVGRSWWSRAATSTRISRATACGSWPAPVQPAHVVLHAAAADGVARHPHPGRRTVREEQGEVEQGAERQQPARHPVGDHEGGGGGRQDRDDEHQPVEQAVDREEELGDGTSRGDGGHDGEQEDDGAQGGREPRSPLPPVRAVVHVEPLTSSAPDRPPPDVLSRSSASGGSHRSGRTGAVRPRWGHRSALRARSSGARGRRTGPDRENGCGSAALTSALMAGRLGRPGRAPPP